MVAGRLPVRAGSFGGRPVVSAVMTTSPADLAEARAPETARVVPRNRFGWVREVAIVQGFYYVYQAVRSLADQGNGKSRAHGNAHTVVELEQTLHIFHEQAIQSFFLGAYWFIRAMNIYYGTLHFLITAGLLVWMYLRRHDGYRRMRNLLGATTGLALIGYWTFPLAPPRLYTCNDDVPVVGPEGYQIGKCFVDTLEKYGGLWSYTSPAAKAIANQYAAMPSLHFGWALWCGIVFWVFVGGRKGRMLAILYPSLTLFAIVVTANHYFLDALGGAVILLAGEFVLVLTARRRTAREQAALQVAPTE